MRIALVFDCFVWGGIERVGISYANTLTKLGHTIDAYILDKNCESIVEELRSVCPVTIIDYKKNWCPEAAWSTALYNDCHGIEMAYFAFKYILRETLQFIRKPRYRVKDKEYDIVIAFSGHAKDLSYVASNHIKAKHKIAWLHGSQYSYALLSPGFFRLYKKIKNLVCLSDLGDADCFEFNQANGIEKRKIYNPCLVNTKDIDEEKVAELKARYGDFCLMVARLAQDKDQETVIRAMHYLKEELGMRKTLLLVGDGDRRKKLEALVAELGMQEDVVFTGTRSDVQNYYLAAAMYVHAAPLEGLPTVFMEAMSYGIPIVTTDAIPGAREMLGNDQYGLISPHANPEKLALNIKRLYEDEDLRKTYIEKGKQRLLDFHPDKIGQQFEAFLQEIMNRS